MGRIAEMLQQTGLFLEITQGSDRISGPGRPAETPFPHRLVPRRRQSGRFHPAGLFCIASEAGVRRLLPSRRSSSIQSPQYHKESHLCRWSDRPSTGRRASVCSWQCKPISYQIEGICDPRCGSLSRYGLPVSVRSPWIAQLLEPIPSKPPPVIPSRFAAFVWMSCRDLDREGQKISSRYERDPGSFDPPSVSLGVIGVDPVTITGWSAG